MNKSNLYILIILSLIFISCNLLKDTDETPPEIQIVSPVNNSQVSGNVLISVIVSDNEEVSKVEFYIDNQKTAEDKSDPFQYNWNTTDLSSGNHAIYCIATDNSGNTATSEIITVNVVNFLFKATFIDDWLCESCGEGAIFLSYPDGSLLDWKIWEGNETLIFNIPDSTNELPDYISVTTIDTAGYCTITTNMKVPVGSSWTWKGYPQLYNEIHTIQLNFSNIPEYSSYLISSLGRSYWGSSLTSPYEYSMWDNTEGIYINLNTTSNGPMHKWIGSVAWNAGSYSIDLSDMNNSTLISVSLPNQFYDRLYVRHNGYPEEGSYYNGFYRTDYQIYRDTTLSQINIAHPDMVFNDSYTSFSLFTDDFNTLQYYAVYGSIPSSFESLDGDISIISGDPDHVKLSTLGTFDQISSNWFKADDQRWIIYSANLEEYSLPELPNYVQSNYGVNRYNFNLYWAYLYDHSQLNGYSEIVNILFESSNYFYNVVNDVRILSKSYNGSRSNNIELYIDQIEKEIQNGRYPY